MALSTGNFIIGQYKRKLELLIKFSDSLPYKILKASLSNNLDNRSAPDVLTGMISTHGSLSYFVKYS
jgi:hypothetical protein